jgi:hypothetical protein
LKIQSKTLVSKIYKNIIEGKPKTNKIKRGNTLHINSKLGDSKITSKLKSISLKVKSCKTIQKIKIIKTNQKNKAIKSDISSLSKVTVSCENKIKFLKI